MQSLPLEDIFSLALELPTRDIFSLCSTSKSWSNLCQDQYLWKLLVARDFGVATLPIQYVEDWKSYYKNLERFYSSFIYLVIVTGYSGQSKQDIEEEYKRLEQDHAYFVEETGQPFVLVPSQPDYHISQEEVTFYFALKPSKPGLTILDLQKMVDTWEEILEEENEKASSEFINYGYASGYKIVRPRE
ncbi:F-box domain-containing protein [Cedratvirus kamchatka]|uniref:F-box domain-containing protein n=1 Tax=Cedratvirus kamchatka TaxID=2716914 RepID=A0A6G8MY18_9VIRU|nr:F-box domain-containing protein [Cedratvirus kamchatka]WIL03986.1 F-box domain-containing protein [Cedratvirus lena]WIL04596.1 F-box domain-containing protein [Cedratvirus duvanny]